MSGTFSDLYQHLSKDIFRQLVQQQMEQGSDPLTCADAYAEEGKPDFVLAYLLVTETDDTVKQEIFARSYEQRAALSEQKGEEFSRRFHRDFPMITQEAQKDRLAAQRIRQGQRIRKGGGVGKMLSVNTVKTKI